MAPQTRTPILLDPMSAVLARVAYRLIQVDYRQRPSAYLVPVNGLLGLADRLRVAGFPALSTWITTYAYRLGKGHSTGATKQWLVARARWAALNRQEGKPWARVPER